MPQSFVNNIVLNLQLWYIVIHRETIKESYCLHFDKNKHILLRLALLRLTGGQQPTIIARITFLPARSNTVGVPQTLKLIVVIRESTILNQKSLKVAIIKHKRIKSLYVSLLETLLFDARLKLTNKSRATNYCFFGRSFLTSSLKSNKKRF